MSGRLRKRSRRADAPCFKQTCARRGKVKHECTICGHVLRACNFHKDVCFSALQQHVIAEHPAEYRAAKDAQALRAIRPEPAPQATDDPMLSYGAYDGEGES